MATSNLPSDYPGSNPDAERRAGSWDWWQKKYEMISKGTGLKIFQGVLAAGVVTALGVQHRDAIHENIASVRGVSTAPKPGEVERVLRQAGFECTKVVSVDGEPDGCVVYLDIADPLAVSDDEIAEIKKAMRALGATSITLIVPNTDAGTPFRELSLRNAGRNWWSQPSQIDQANMPSIFSADALGRYGGPMTRFAEEKTVEELAEGNIPKSDDRLGLAQPYLGDIRNMQRDPASEVLRSRYKLIVGKESKLSTVAQEFMPANEDNALRPKVSVLHVTRPNKNGE